MTISAAAAAPANAASAQPKPTVGLHRARPGKRKGKGLKGSANLLQQLAPPQGAGAVQPNAASAAAGPGATGAPGSLVNVLA